MRAYAGDADGSCELNAGDAVVSLRGGRFVLDALAARGEDLGEICLPAVPSAPEPSFPGQVWQRFSSDEELAAQLQRGSADALTVLFKRHSGLLFGIARRILRNDAEAEDAVQQIFLDVFRSIGQFEPEKGTFKAWLLMFTYHRTFNSRRSQLARRWFNTDPLDDGLLGLLPMKNYSPAESSILLGQVLRSLQPRQRRTIVLIYYEGLTAEEISIRTGESVRVVRHNLYRGLERLRRTFCDGLKNDGGAS